jgi:hypothetical protein
MPFAKVEWGRGRKQEFIDWIYNELWQTEGDRSVIERKWLDLISQHRARVIGDGTADVPFIGASDVDFPLTAIHYEPVYADLMQTLHIPKDFWSVVALQPDRVPYAKPFQEFLSHVEKTDIRMRKVNEKALIDLLILGTNVYKDSIRHEIKTRKDYDEMGQITNRTLIDFKPQGKHIPLQDFFIPAYASSIDPDEIGGAPWVSHRFELTEGQFAARAEGQSPFLPNYDKKAVQNVQRYVVDDREDKIKERQRAEDEFQPFHDRKIHLHEIWARFDVDGNGIDEDIVVVWHQESRTILRATYNPYIHGKRPFSSGNYMPGPGFYGIGIAEADEWAQLIMSRLLNSAVNNTLIANQRMYAVPLGAHISPDEPIYGGKIWPIGPNEKIGEIRLGDTYPSLFNLMDGIMQYAEQRTSVSELRQGDLANLPSRTPASTVLSALKEGKKKFDMVMAGLRDSVFNEMGQRVVQNLVQISKDDPRYIALAYQVMGDVDGAMVAEILQGPVHDIEEKFGISVSATSSIVNKEVEKQNFVGMGQMIAQIYPQMMQYAQILAQAGDSSTLVSTVQAAYQGQVELLTRLLETFDVQNPEVYLPVSQQPMQPQVGQQMQPGMGATAQALGGAFGPSPLAQGVDPLSALLGIG